MPRLVILVALVVALLTTAASGATGEWAFSTFFDKKAWRVDVIEDRHTALDDDASDAGHYLTSNGTLEVAPSTSYDDVSIGTATISSFAGALPVKVEASSATEGRLTLSTGDAAAAVAICCLSPPQKGLWR